MTAPWVCRTDASNTVRPSAVRSKRGALAEDAVRRAAAQRTAYSEPLSETKKTVPSGPMAGEELMRAPVVT
jgi:hypothetical protein